MSIRIKVQQILSFILIFKKIRSIKASFFLSAYYKNYSFNTGEKFYWENDQLTFPDYEISLNKDDIGLFHKSLKNIITTLKNYKLEKKNSGEILLNLKNNDTQLKFKIKLFDSINALNEIYLEKLYYFQSENDYVVLDIGMNIGAASLYFATDIKVKRVYAYEPFGDTFSMAIENFDLNPSVASKIIPHNYGLSDSDRTIRIPLAGAGFMGASTTTEFIEEQMKVINIGNRFVDVQLRSVSDELNKVRKANKGSKICLKIDCEGAEFEIIKDLKLKNLLNEISVMIIEWHFQDKFIIIKDLEKAGYIVFSQDRDAGSPMGMIYAVNKNNMI